jgi:hypothetical protein
MDSILAVSGVSLSLSNALFYQIKYVEYSFPPKNAKTSKIQT